MDAHSMVSSRRWKIALALGLALAFGGVPAQAQLDPQAQRTEETQVQRQQVQPGNNAPVWREVRREGEHFTTIKGPEAGVLIHSLGQTWREIRNSWIVPIVGWFIVLVACLVGIFHWGHGPIRLEGKPTGRLIRRFTTLQRVAHWGLGISFSILAVTGLVMLLGKHVLLPLVGYTLFSWLAEISKGLHNFVGPVFAASVVLAIIVFVKDLLPARGDLSWMVKGGGVLSGGRVACGKHHAFHKLWFWGSVVILSTIISATGLVLDFPTFEQTRAVMIVMNIVHAVAAGLLMANSVIHIYMGTRGVEGAYEGMRYGYVDETYAKEHHLHWYEDVKAGKVETEIAEGTPEAPQALQPARG